MGKNKKQLFIRRIIVYKLLKKQAKPVAAKIAQDPLLLVAGEGPFLQKTK